jgi:hypothetical protein
MVGNRSEPNGEAAGPFTNPWPAMIISLGAIVAGLGLGSLAPGRMGIILLFLVAIGILAAGIAVAIQPRSSLVLALAAAAALVASFVGNKTDWDSARLVLRVLSALAAFSAIVVLFPSTVRRVVISLIILFHFGGILTAVNNPSNSWLTYNIWIYLYRPYLVFLYMNNAYHFYAPEPGPTPLLWFCIEYERNPDKSKNIRWVKVPDLDKDYNRLRPDGTRLWPNLEYTRRLSLGDNANRTSLNPQWNFNELMNLRMAAGEQFNIPMHPDIPYNMQFREPSDEAKLHIQSHVRHVAQTFPHQTKPELNVIGIKVYVVIHMVAEAPIYEAGIDPRDPALYRPFFMGEFDKDGKIKPYAKTLQTFPLRLSNLTKMGTLDRDPFLYWLIPIVRTSNDPFRDLKSFYKNSKIVNYLKIHAGDSDEGDLP